MTLDRRKFMQIIGAGAFGGAAGQARASETGSVPADGIGMLVDLTECIGCRKCEFACDRQNGLSDRTMEEFEDTSVFDKARRMEHDSYTVVNRYLNPEDPENPIYVKAQCMHCLHPACVSACLVGALTKADNGAVIYDSWKCMGCRYCMVACPFQVPAYEYENTLAPRVRKCIFCFERIATERKVGHGETWVEQDIFETAQHNIPACAEMCPPQAITFGPRADLLTLAHEKIAENPGRYFDKVYGEHDAGGTAWLYLSPVPFSQLGFLDVGDKPLPAITEGLQHSVFRYGVPPLLGFALLGAAMKVFKDEEEHPEVQDSDPAGKEKAQ